MHITKLRDLREDNDFTQTYIAELLNISQRAYSHYENGTREIPLEILIKLADFYKLSIDELIGRTPKRSRK